MRSLTFAKKKRLRTTAKAQLEAAMPLEWRKYQPRTTAHKVRKNCLERLLKRLPSKAKAADAHKRMKNVAIRLSGREELHTLNRSQAAHAEASKKVV